MPNNYDPIAKNYDWLSRLVFGQKLILAQTCFLEQIPTGSKVLMIGGGSGWILEELAKIHPSGLTVTYIELSGEMLSLAQKRAAGKNSVAFVNQAIEEYPENEIFDVIFTAFLFDNFEKNKVALVFDKLQRLLKNEGKWLFADFHIDNESKFWQKLLLKVMLLFFRIVCGIEARTLEPIHALFYQNVFKRIYHKSLMHGFIQSSVFIKSQR